MNARTKLIGTIAVGAALFVPVAQAQSPDDRAGLRGPGGIEAQQAGGASSHPDNRAVRGTGGRGGRPRTSWCGRTIARGLAGRAPTAQQR